MNSKVPSQSNINTIKPRKDVPIKKTIKNPVQNKIENNTVEENIAAVKRIQQNKEVWAMIPENFKKAVIDILNQNKELRTNLEQKTKDYDRISSDLLYIRTLPDNNYVFNFTLKE
jgi:hypothetical protein